MTSTGMMSNGIGNEILRQQLMNKLAQINYMQSIHSFNPNLNPYLQSDYLSKQQHLIQQQMNDLNMQQAQRQNMHSQPHMQSQPFSKPYPNQNMQFEFDEP